jgi:hypothetical protein
MKLDYNCNYSGEIMKPKIDSTIDAFAASFKAEVKKEWTDFTCTLGIKYNKYEIKALIFIGLWQVCNGPENCHVSFDIDLNSLPWLMRGVAGNRIKKILTEEMEKLK